MTSVAKTWKAAPIFLAFLCMGFGDAVGPFVGLAKETFSLSNLEAQLIAFAGFIMFFFLSVPMGVFQDRRGKKYTLIIGLFIALAGLIIPVIGGLQSYLLFLLTVFMLGAGATILQVAGNPIMREVSPEGKYARNLALGQFVKAIGSLAGPLLVMAAARWWGMDWSILFPVFSAVLLITIIITLLTPIREMRLANASTASFSSCLRLLRDKSVAMMVLGIFLYVGAEVCMSSGIPIYLNSEFGIDISSIGIGGVGLFFVSIMTGRFLGSIVLNWISARRFLLITVLVSIVGILGLFSGNQIVGIASFVVIGLGFANIFPLIFSIAIDAMPERSNELSGLMIMAIVGGAVMPPVMGLVADQSSVLLGFVVPLCCTLYILWVALRSLKTT